MSPKRAPFMARTLLHLGPSRNQYNEGRPARRRAGSRGGFYRPVRALAAGLLLLTLLTGGVQPAASAPDEQGQDTSAAGSVRMDVRAGFDGAGRVGGWVPLDVQVVNEGSELKASVEVVVD